MARRKETEDVKAFKTLLRGLPSSDVQEFTKQFKELKAKIAEAWNKAKAREALSKLPTEEIQAELDRRRSVDGDKAKKTAEKAVKIPSKKKK